MTSSPPTSRRTGTDLRGQARVIYEVRRRVDEWRGFELGKAAEPFPVQSPRYEPARDGDQEVTQTTRSLLHHWFRREPHEQGTPPNTFAFKYWPHQRRLVETFIYLYEVRGIRRTEQLYELTGVEPLGPQRDPWTKLGGQLATGSGKTKMMALLIAWGYLNARLDIKWWEDRSAKELAHVWKRHESLPLYPEHKGSNAPPPPSVRVLPTVPERDQFRTAVPVYDLAVAAGAFGESQAPESAGWMHVTPSHQMDRRLFVARVVGHSMEDAIPDGSWGLFRMYADGTAPSPLSLDGKRVVVQLRDHDDPETGGRYTLKRWRVSKHSAEHGVEEIELRPDNPGFVAKKYSAADGDVRVVAEFLEVVG